MIEYDSLTLEQGGIEESPRISRAKACSMIRYIQTQAMLSDDDILQLLLEART